MFRSGAIEKGFDAGVARGPEDTSQLLCLEQSETYLNNEYPDAETWLGFHRLAINGLDSESGQPMSIGRFTLICNGEIYNYKALAREYDIRLETGSDCEIIIHLCERIGIEGTLRRLHGVFAFVLYERPEDPRYQEQIYMARDRYGVRPLYKLSGPTGEILAIASEGKQLHPLADELDTNCMIHQFEPGTYCTLVRNSSASRSVIETVVGDRWQTRQPMHKRFSITASYRPIWPFNWGTDTEVVNSALRDVYNSLDQAVAIRVANCQRPIACLLSGGLDSSLIAALVKKHYTEPLETYSIGIEGSKDLEMARAVAHHIGSNHHEVTVSTDSMINSIPEVVRVIESYDTTTVRASVPNWLVCGEISKNSSAKVIFNGDGSDEVTGGYIYTLMAGTSGAFDNECHRLLDNIHFYDGLRSDRCISAWGLEARTPFLDTHFVDTYMSVPFRVRNPRDPHNPLRFESGIATPMCEKALLRCAIQKHAPGLLPTSVLWRRKEAFSDGVSGEKSWFEVIKDALEGYHMRSMGLSCVNPPKTAEQQFYRDIYDNAYPYAPSPIPAFWMPRFVQANDASARTLDVYNE